MFMFCLESSIAPDAFVRGVDAVVDAIDMKDFGFLHMDCREEGRPLYHCCISVPGDEKLIQALRKCSVYLFSWSFRLVLSFFKQFWVKSQIHIARPDVK